MFSAVPERKMRFVQGLVFLGWCTLILSLFWDPWTPNLTLPGADASPFRVATSGVQVQDGVIQNHPYAMGNRIFWTMALPLLPMFLMVFGHEAWRRICPLSFASQAARRLGFARKRKSVDRSTGVLKRTHFLIGKESWLARNAWYVQFFLLYLGLVARLLFINSDRTALGIFFVGVIAVAATIGFLWDGKTWCNYICPVNVVQKIYTEPRGIFESSPHRSTSAISQSMCRTAIGIEKSACVSCASSCGDIDLERSYWDTIDNPARRHVYYMFFGLIWGFYGYYYVFAGNWDYYFSGIWTHEDGAIGKLFSPGIYIGGTAYDMPKIVAAPLVLALACLGSLLLGIWCESLYRKARSKSGDFSIQEVTNHCLSFAAYISINAFYLFGGRPNIMLMPPNMVRVIDILIVALSSWWFWQAIARTPRRYKRESVAFALTRQLQDSSVDLAKHFDGRPLSQLSPDEVYVAAKILPEITYVQKKELYRKVLEEAVANDRTGSATSLEMLREMRSHIGISDKEQDAIVQDLQLADTVNLDPQKIAVRKRSRNARRYATIMGWAIAGRVERGAALDAVLSDPDVASTDSALRNDMDVDVLDREEIVSNILRHDGPLAARAIQNLDSWQRLATGCFAVDVFRMNSAACEKLGALLTAILDSRMQVLGTKMLNTLRVLGDINEARWIAHNMAVLAGDRASALLALPCADAGSMMFEDCLPPEIVLILKQGHAHAHLMGPLPEGVRAHAYREVIDAGQDPAATLSSLASSSTLGDDVILVAIALTSLAEIDHAAAAELGRVIRSDGGGTIHAVLDEAIDSIASSRPMKADREVANGDGTAFAVGDRATVVKMARLFACPLLRTLNLSALAQVAQEAEVRAYTRGPWIHRLDPGQPRTHVICDGLVELVALHGGEGEVVHTSLGAGNLIPVLAIDGAATGVRVLSPEATVATVPNSEMLVRHLESLMPEIFASQAAALERLVVETHD